MEPSEAAPPSLEAQKKSKEIDGFTYEVLPLPFGPGRRALMRTVRILSPILSAAFKQKSGAELYASVFDALPHALSDDDVTYFAELFGKQSKYLQDGKGVPLVPANQEFHFAGRYGAFLRWIAFSMEVNFGGFFVESMRGSGVTDLMQMMSQAAK